MNFLWAYLTSREHPFPNWSPCGSVLLALITRKGTSRKLCWLITEKKKNSGSCFQIYQCLAYNPHSSFQPTLFFHRFDGDIKIMLETLMKFFMLVLVSSLNDRKSLGHKANIDNPNANIICPPPPPLHWTALQQSVSKTHEDTPISPYRDGAPSYSETCL